MNVDVTLTDAACEQLKKSLSEKGRSAVRLSVREAGCSGLEYVIDYADEPKNDDLRCEYDGFSLFVDGESYEQALVGLIVDYQQDMMSSAFVFQNPNKKGECGCGVSFTI
ncbi:MAG: iron-sulfur cluster assembly accessory protein [Mariprofundaceae bacterium]